MEERLFSHDGLFLLLSTFLNSIPIGFINVVPLVYLAEIGYDPSTIGIIYSASAIATTLAMIPCGLLADRCDRKKLLMIGTFLPCISYTIFGLTLDSTLLTIASIIGGVGFAGGLGSAIVTPALIPMLASSTSINRRSTLFGVLMAAWSVALTIGSAIGFLPTLLSSYFAQSESSAHFQSYFIMAGIAAVAMFPLYFVKGTGDGYDLKNTDSSPSSTSFMRKRQDGSDRFDAAATSRSRIIQFSIVFAFSGFGLGVLVQLLPTWFALRYYVSESTIGFWMALSNLATVVSIPLIPRLVSRKGAVSTAVATGIVGAFLLALMPFATFETAASLFVIRGVVIGVSWAVLQSYMMSVVSENERATIIGFTYTAWGIGVSLGIFVGGELLSFGLLTLIFVSGVISYLLSSTVFSLFFRKLRPHDEGIRFNIPRVSD